MFSNKIFHIIKWIFLVILFAFIILVIVRFFHYFDVKKNNEQILKIHSTKISMADVTGENLPVEPGDNADKTIQGIDSNKNGIRDDVEIAIFEEYPNSMKTRAVLLQYALALQMMVNQPFVNEEIATEVIREEDRANTCLSDQISPRKDPELSREYSDIEKIDLYSNFIKNKQFNTKDRENNRSTFLKKVRSFYDLEGVCDIDLSKLLN